MSRLEVLRPLLAHAYELRVAEARARAEAEARAKHQREEDLRRQAEIKQRAEEAARSATLADESEDSSEDELVARAQRLKLGQPARQKAPSPAATVERSARHDDDGSDVSDSDLPPLSAEELKAFENELENSPEAPAKEESSSAPLVAVPDPHLDALFASGKIFGGLDAIGNSSVAKPEAANTVASGYAITVTPFSSGLLRPDVVENNPPLIDLSATNRPQTLMMMPQRVQHQHQYQTAAPAAPHLMDLATIPTPSATSPTVSNPASPILSFAPPPAVVPQPTPPSVVTPAAVPVVAIPLAPPPSLSTPPSAPPLEVPALQLSGPKAAVTAPTAPAVAPSAPVETIVPQVRAAAAPAARPRVSELGGDLVMERPRVKTPDPDPAVPAKVDPPVQYTEVIPVPVPRKSDRMGELPPPLEQPKKSPTVSKKVSFEEPRSPESVAEKPQKVRIASIFAFFVQLVSPSRFETGSAVSELSSLS